MRSIEKLINYRQERKQIREVLSLDSEDFC